MTAHRIAWLMLGLAIVAGCTGGASDQPSGPTPVVARTAPTQTARVWPEVPAERSNLPDGVYRTELPVERLRAFGIDEPGMAGTWTLTVKAGTFKLECQPVTTPGLDCGGHDPSLPPLVEVGTLQGTGQTVWFVQDGALRAELTGCVRHSERKNGCGPEDPYHFDCTVDGKGMSCRNYGGLGDQNPFPELSNWTVQPWTRIA
jgi:hypothetical protein